MKKYYIISAFLLIVYVFATYSICCMPKKHNIQIPEANEIEEVKYSDESIYNQEAKPAAFPRIECPLDDYTQQMIVDKCEHFDIDFAFTMAVIFNESSFNPKADSGSSVGLMQINRCNHAWLTKEVGFTDFFDPEQNVTAGLYMLRNLFEKYEDPALVLMCYNMGEGKALQMWNDGVYSTAYTRAVFNQQKIYNAQIEEYLTERN